MQGRLHTLHLTSLLLEDPEPPYYVSAVSGAPVVGTSVVCKRDTANIAGYFCVGVHYEESL